MHCALVTTLELEEFKKMYSHKCVTVCHNINVGSFFRCANASDTLGPQLEQQTQVTKKVQLKRDMYGNQTF